MRPSEAPSLHGSQIREIALRHRVSSARVFGSELHGDDTADSDLDLLVEPIALTTLKDVGAIRFELKQLLGMEVAVLTPNSLPASFQDQVLREAIAETTNGVRSCLLPISLRTCGAGRRALVAAFAIFASATGQSGM